MKLKIYSLKIFSSFVSIFPAEFVAHIERLAAFAQGKGSASGWDIASEASVAAQNITSNQPVILDVGAHRGEWTLLLDTLLRKQGITPQFHLFEPSPTSFQSLVDNPQLASSRFTLHNIGIGATTGSSQFHEPTPGSLLSSILPRQDSFLQTHRNDPPQAPLEIQIRSIDDFLESQNFPIVDFLKLDIEGLELDALHGAARSLQEDKIHALSFEFGSANLASRSTFRDFFDILTTYHMDIYRIRPGGRLIPIPRYTEELEYYRGATNYLAKSNLKC